MVDFVQLQEVLKARLEQDRAIHSIEVTGPTLEAVTADAAAILDIPMRHLEYEVVERGSPGFMGVGKKEWRIQAYEKLIVSKQKHGEELLEEAGEQAPIVEDRDGQVFIHFSSIGEAQIKVTAPSGNGRKASENYALQSLKERLALHIDMALISKTVKEAAGVYVTVGDYERHSYNDSVVRTEISDGEMYGYMTVTPPGEGGADISYDSFINIFKMNKLVHGVKEEMLRGLVDQPIYSEKIEIAEGTKAYDGKDAYIQYYFETDQNKVRLKEGASGKIDFKELNIIQNVTENQLLAKKIAAEQGKPGSSVTGKWINATNGKDINLPVGNNTHVGDEGDTILADINGQALMVSGLVNVEPVFTVAGDVNLKTGN
ncbi:MAG: FapA family protein, partial [Treponema sp.]|nr:FapA family protein [Treponema sp.]